MNDLLDFCQFALIVLGALCMALGLKFIRFPREPLERKVGPPMIAIGAVVFVTLMLVQARVISFAVSEVVLLPFELAGFAYVAFRAYRQSNWSNFVFFVAMGATMIGLVACAWHMAETKFVFLTIGAIGNYGVLAFAIFGAGRRALEKGRAKARGAAVNGLTEVRSRRRSEQHHIIRGLVRWSMRAPRRPRALARRASRGWYVPLTPRL